MKSLQIWSIRQGKSRTASSTLEQPRYFDSLGGGHVVFNSMTAVLAATLVGSLTCGARAQTPEVAESRGACYKVVAARSEPQPEGAILLNRCSGQTWILIRPHGKATGDARSTYLWRPIATADT
jgi:hypothetical protein